MIWCCVTVINWVILLMKLLVVCCATPPSDRSKKIRGVNTVREEPSRCALEPDLIMKLQIMSIYSTQTS